ncbi:MAG: carboxypeptidase regulatory-like domain-containing protein [Armatimonadota bacterium]
MHSSIIALYFPPDPHPRFNAQAIFADGKVHWAGGYGNTVTNPLSGKTYYSNRQSGYSIYDPITNTWASSKWSDDPQYPVGIDNNGDGIVAEPEGTYPGTCQTFAYDLNGDGKKEIWIHAGYPCWDGNFFVYDPAVNKWSTRGSFPGFSDGGYKAQYLGVAALWKDSLGTAWVFCAGGGFWGPDSKSFAKYDIQADAWTELPDMPVSMIAHVGAVINGKLYLAGGNQNNTPSSTGIWEYDCASGAWTVPPGETEPGPVANLLVGVERAAVGVYNGKLYIIGGQTSTGGDYDGIQVFDPVNRSVTLLGNLPVAMSRHGGCIDPATGDIYVGAGRQNGEYLTYEPWWKANVNMSPLSWTQLPDDPAYFPYEDWVVGGEKTLSGTVTGPDGKPLPQAVVAIKKKTRGPYATADAQIYALTDGSGRYSVALLPGEYNVAAWRYAYKPCPDKPLTMGEESQTLDLQITEPAGQNIALGATVYVSSETGGEPASGAVDNDMWSRWSTEGGTGADHYYIIDLGSVQDISGITIFWEAARPGIYTIDFTNDDPNPSGGAAWTNVYTCPKGGGGFDMGYGHFLDAVGFTELKQARGIRFHLTAFSQWWQGNYSAYEFMVHSTTPGTPPITIAAAKQLPDGTLVELFNVVSVSGASEFGESPIFPNTFWLQESNASGIRVEYTQPVAWPGEWDYVKGTVETDPVTGERYIQATEVQTWAFLGVEFAPQAMNNKACVETKNPWGIRVKTWGKVTDMVPDQFMISDNIGAPNEVDIQVKRRSPAPEVGSFITVSGALAGGGVLFEWPFDGYIRSWLMHGAYSVADPGGDAYAWQQANLDEDFLASQGGEANIQPIPGDVGPNGAPWFVWSIKPWEAIIDLNKPTWKPSGQNQSCIYASVWILADRTYTGESGDGLELWVGSDDGYKVYWNGTAIYENNIWRGVGRDQDKIPNIDWTGGDLYVLNPGWNHILFKVNNITGGFGMCARLMVYDPAGSGERVPLLLPYAVAVFPE